MVPLGTVKVMLLVLTHIEVVLVITTVYVPPKSPLTLAVQVAPNANPLHTSVCVIYGVPLTVLPL